eukprot:1143390-Pleurochrysis_carterae.AAC.1
MASSWQDNRAQSRTITAIKRENELFHSVCDRKQYLSRTKHIERLELNSSHKTHDRCSFSKNQPLERGLPIFLGSSMQPRSRTEARQKQIHIHASASAPCARPTATRTYKSEGSPITQKTDLALVCTDCTDNTTAQHRERTLSAYRWGCLKMACEPEQDTTWQVLAQKVQNG